VSRAATPSGPLSRSAARRIDQACDRFERAWRAGERPRLEEALGETAEPERSLLFRELLAVELELRRGGGEAPSPADYLARFPDYAELLRTMLDGAPAGGLAPPGYEILSELGRGGMGVVYLARQRRPGRVVALKVVRADPLHGLSAAEAARRVERFRREVEAAGRLEHEHLVPVYEAGEYNGRLYYAMRYVKGQGLHELARAGPLAGPAAAAYLEPAARAVHHAHRHGVLHRDLKPHNILVEAESGRPFVTDFGLAKVLEGATALTGTRELIGTPYYMAPEQVHSPERVGPAADVYGLGATLYHLLTGRPPFQAASLAATVHQVVHEEPVPPRRLNPSLDAPLETVVLKCLAKEPERRYASAEALADDLGRYRRGEPVLARPAGRLERGRLWCRRNPGKAVLLAGLVVSLVGLAAAAAWGYLENRAWAEAQARAADESRARERDQKREALLQRLQALLRPAERPAGWSEEAWQLVTEAAALPPAPGQADADERLRFLAGCALAGLDARQEAASPPTDTPGACALAFAPDGRLLLGGAANIRGRVLEGARLWDWSAGKLGPAGEPAAGPVAFRAAGRPVQLVARPGPVLAVCDVTTGRPLAECRFPGGSGRPRAQALVQGVLRQGVMALSADGATAAAAADRGPGAKALVVVWDAATGRPLLEREGDVWALALSARGDLLVVAGTDERVRIWSVPAGEELAVFRGPPVRANCLAFSPDAGTVGPGGRALRGRLALGDAGGTATLWDLTRRACENFCRGGPYDTFAVAFSPDGTLLACGGRSPVRLFETATGRPLLTLEAGDYILHLTFSPDGARLATSTAESDRRVLVWRLEDGRGMRTLRGLSSHVTQVRLSADGQRLAALAGNWQVGVWDRATGRRRHLLPVASGATADNAALAFSPDGRRLAFAAGRQARLWELETGRVLGTWPLPRGLIDRLAFHPSGKLLLGRMELRGDPGPRGDLDFRKHPRLYRVRSLTAPGDAELLFTIDCFNETIFSAALTPDGRTLVLDGRRVGADGTERQLAAFDGLSGAPRWAVRSDFQAPTSHLVLDPNARLLLTNRSAGSDQFELLDLASGRVVERLGSAPHHLGPGASYRVWYRDLASTKLVQGLALMRPGQERPAVTLGPEATQAFTLTISPDGEHWAWGNAGGTVTLADLRRINQRLSQVGLGW
jgi:WD40 repeat protein/predicted Ser/Thr protein kinase